MMQKTLYPATRALSVGNDMQTLVSVPAMSSVLRLVSSMACDPRRVVPGVDLAGARDVDRVGIVLMDLGDERAVRPVGDRGRGEGRNLGEVGHLRQRGHVRAQRRKVDVPDQLEQPALVVDQQHDGVVGVDHPLVDFGHGFVLSLCQCSETCVTWVIPKSTPAAIFNDVSG